jgi:hypothetical protein
MPLRIVQLDDTSGRRILAAMTDDGRAHRINGHDTTYDLAQAAIAAGSTLAEAVEAAGPGQAVDVRAALAEGRVRAPIDHPDPAHMVVTGTGLTHLGSAEGRDKMHRDISDAAALTDSMKMFKLGLEGGKPEAGETGVQPEWFYKGDGAIVAAPGGALNSPAFALDGGEEPELAGIYVIGPDGTPFRLGFALGNEFSDHVTERQNYLYLAHSKLRACSLGAELLLGDPPADVRGTVRIRRGDEVLWEKPFLSGEANMCHSLANLEHHHFKYAQFRRPGDVHVHFMGTATLSFSDGIETRPGDVFEVEAAPFLTPVRNPLAVETPTPVTVRSL